MAATLLLVSAIPVTRVGSVTRISVKSTRVRTMATALPLATLVSTALVSQGLLAADVRRIHVKKIPVLIKANVFPGMEVANASVQKALEETAVRYVKYYLY